MRKKPFKPNLVGKGWIFILQGFLSHLPPYIAQKEWLEKLALFAVTLYACLSYVHMRAGKKSERRTLIHTYAHIHVHYFCIAWVEGSLFLYLATTFGKLLLICWRQPRKETHDFVTVAVEQWGSHSPPIIGLCKSHNTLHVCTCACLGKAQTFADCPDRSLWKILVMSLPLSLSLCQLYLFLVSTIFGKKSSSFSMGYWKTSLHMWGWGRRRNRLRGI